MASQPPHLEITNRFRIYVALTALLHKPPEQSYHSYILDLRTKFPLPGTSPNAGSQQCWRNHALSLENQLKETENKMQRVHLELQKLRETSSQKRSSEENGKQEDGQVNRDSRPKKKRKPQVDPQAHPVSVDWNEAMKNLDATDQALWPPSFRGNLDMLNALVRLSQTTKQEKTGKKHFALAIQCLTLVGGMLKAALTQSISPSSRSLIKELSALIPLIIDQSLTSVVVPDISQGPVEAFVQALHEQVILTSVLHFSILSDCGAASLGARHGTHEEPQRFTPSGDLRPILLSLCQCSLNSLNSYPRLRASLSVVLSHCIVTQLRTGLDLLRLPISNGAPTAKTGSNATGRVRRLAFKDTFWYLVSLLDTCFSSVPAGTRPGGEMSPLEEAAKTTVLVSLAEILEKDERRGVIGLVERNMLVGVVEQAWKNGWAPFCQQEEVVNDGCGGVGMDLMVEDGHVISRD